MADWTERLFTERAGAVAIVCQGCGVTMYIPPSKIGQRAYCSIECKSNHPIDHMQSLGRLL